MASISEKLSKAEEHKLKGNEYFKQQKYKKAIVSYNTVAAFTRGLPGSKRGLDGVSSMAVKANGEDLITPEEEAKATDLECTAAVNAAFCFLKLDKPREALDSANKALQINSSHWKALLRKGEAQSLLKDFDKARTTLNAAMTNTSDVQAHAAISKELKLVSSREKEEDQKQKKAFAGLFARANEKEVAETRKLSLQPSESTDTTCTPPPAAMGSSSSSSSSRSVELTPPSGADELES